MPKELQGIYRCLNTYHEGNESGADLSVSDLSNLYFATRPRDRDFAISVFEQLDKHESGAETVGRLVGSIVQGKLLREISLEAYDVAEGRGKLEEVLNKMLLLQTSLEGTAEESEASVSEFVSDDLEELVNGAIKKPGLRWRLKTLNRMLGSLRGGDFGFVFARPETGKTTFLASEVTYMAEQVPNEAGPVLWINNEEQGSKVKIRCAQASLGITMTDLFRDVKKANAAYQAKMRGKLMMVDDAGMSKQKLEALCRKLKPSLIVIDQIDKIKGFDNDREDLRLGAIYQWARELAKTHDCPVIAVCQADGTGEGQRWLTMAHVANAKTAKQAEADFIIGIGRVHEPGYDTIRYLHISKNKLMGDEDSDSTLRHGRQEVLIEAETARYKDLM
jgi:replicative DNA helicase